MAILAVLLIIALSCARTLSKPVADPYELRSSGLPGVQAGVMTGALYGVGRRKGFGWDRPPLRRTPVRIRACLGWANPRAKKGPAAKGQNATGTAGNLGHHCGSSNCHQEQSHKTCLLVAGTHMTVFPDLLLISALSRRRGA